MTAVRNAKTGAERLALRREILARELSIDARVYELYGVTDEQIALVEGLVSVAPEPDA